MGNSKFILGDCMDKKTGLPSLPDNSANLFLTDPPFGIDYQSARRTDSLKRHKKIKNDKTPYTVWVNEAYRILKPGGRIVTFYRWDVAYEFIFSLKAAGFDVIWELIWDKVIHGMGDLRAGIAPQHESMIYATKGRYEFPNSRPKSIYRCKRTNANDMIHPNEKPITLFRALLKDFAETGDIVIDPFGGSASSLIACEQMGFDYIGWELDPDYYEAAQKRMSKGIQGLIKFDL
jgi:site-specific DNA-methyltransferase (adenine-specific)